MAKRTGRNRGQAARAKRTGGAGTGPTGSRARARNLAADAADAAGADADVGVTPQEAATIRELFWQDAVRDLLTGMSGLREREPAMFDGRIAVLTRGGQRIPVGDVFPVFACGLPGSARSRAMSVAAECTVFRVKTPEGEVFTLPLAEIRGLHTLTGELLKQLEQQAMEERGSTRPFGFAAYSARRPEEPGAANVAGAAGAARAAEANPAPAPRGG